MRLNKMTMYLIFICSTNTSGIVYENVLSAFRIELGNEWEQPISNDTVCTFIGTTAGKKMGLSLKKYSIDSEYTDLNWARTHFAVNKEIAGKLGKVVSYDTSATMKFGNHQAFELLCFYISQVVDSSIWWAEYSRWTEIGGFGYYASVISDTMTIIRDSTRFKSILDAIVFTPFAGTRTSHPAESVPCRLGGFEKNIWCNLLGRSLPAHADRIVAIQVRKDEMYCRIRQASNKKAP